MAAALKPFLKWAGGKRQLLPSLEAHLPRAYEGRFVEPFVGGGSVFLHFQPQQLAINDFNGELVTTYQVVRDQVEELLEYLRELSHRRDETSFYELRAWDKEGRLATASPVERAGRMIYLNKLGFNGMYRVNRFGHFNVPYGKNPHTPLVEEANLRAVHRYLSTAEVAITQGDYKAVLEACQPGDFVYLDPPYASAEGKGFVAYSSQGFSDEEQGHLRDLLVELDGRGCYWLYSNASVPLVHELFQAYEATTSVVYASRAINSKGSGRGKVPEVLISNYSLRKGEAKTLFDFE